MTSAPDLLAEAKAAVNAAGPLVADAVQGRYAGLPEALEQLYAASDALAHLSSLNWQASIDDSF